MQSPIDIYCENLTDKNLAYLVSNNDHLNQVSVKEADCILHHEVLWADSQTEKKLFQISNAHKTSGKKVIILIVNDFEFKYPHYKNLILLRTSMRSNLKRNNEFILPYSWECSDFAFKPLISNDKPIVGFCGMVSHHRKNLLEIFEISNGVQDNFILRENFWGGAPHDPTIIREFNHNIETSQYILCNRGGGNFSMRFYQTLAFGRIPVLVNTKMVLPLKDIIPWEDIIIFGKNEKDCLKKVILSHSFGRAEKMQEKCAEVFRQYFHPEIVLHSIINDSLKNSKNKSDIINVFNNLFQS